MALNWSFCLVVYTSQLFSDKSTEKYYYNHQKQKGVHNTANITKHKKQSFAMTWKILSEKRDLTGYPESQFCKEEKSG